MDEYKYKFSVVMAVYSVEDYIAEAIDSLINQENINFQEDVQVILVNDGSPDNSEEVCLNYKERYPNNIVYIKKENGGVSSARNKGLELVEGKYVNFLDPDDKLKSDCLYKVYDFFEENYDLIDVVSIPIVFFEAIKSPHILNYKFKGDKIINILHNNNYKDVQLSISSSFVKSYLFLNYKFCEGMKYAEDALLVNKIILEKLKYGVVSSTQYLYRKRNASNSAIQGCTKDIEWYNNSLTKFSLELIKYSIEKLTYIPKYIQFVVMYDLQWKLKIQNISDILNDSEKKNFLYSIKRVLDYIDDIIIFEQRHIFLEHRLFCMHLKYKEDFNIQKVFIKNNIQYYFKDILIHELSRNKMRLEFIKVCETYISFEGWIPNIFILNDEEINISLFSNGNEIKSELKLLNINEEKCVLEKSMYKKCFFEIKIPLQYSDNNFEFEFFLIYQNFKTKLNVLLGKFVRLYSEMNNSYFFDNGYCISYSNNKFYIFKANTIFDKIKFEKMFIKELYSKNKKKIAFIRSIVFILKHFYSKEIWLFMDRINKADDNAEALFEYCAKKSDNIEKYFVLSPECQDYERIAKIGKVIPFGSYKHKLLIILCSKTISSHAEDIIRVPLSSNGKYLKNLFDFKFIFLQHGIIQNNLSDWLNKYNKNIDLFITTSKDEYNSILNNKYYYDKKTVKLTGLSRYDNLINNSNNSIVIMPTWRNNIVSEFNQHTGHRRYNDKFSKSIYFEFYNKLINDERIINLAKNRNYKINFLPHPNIQQQLYDFEKNDYVNFLDINTNYNKVFCESSLLITDYSSVAFDFAYLKKPVIYFQFDYDDIFNGKSHTFCKGYFDYETMGFGEVCYEYEDLVDNIIEYMEKGCKMKQKYKDRVDSFYAFTDRNNCERIYNEIINMK